MTLGSISGSGSRLGKNAQSLTLPDPPALKGRGHRVIVQHGVMGSSMFIMRNNENVSGLLPASGVGIVAPPVLNGS